MAKCAFCEIRDGNLPAKQLQPYWWENVMIFEPLNPVTPGHLLVVPKFHVEDFTDNPTLSGIMMTYAGMYAKSKGGSYNLITSKGVEATQSVFHLHLHLVPRSFSDGLALPWSSGKE